VKPYHEIYGFTLNQWQTFKTEAREILIATAGQRAMITYGELAGHMTTIPVEPHDPVLWHIIGDVARDEEHAGRGLLSVVVVHKHGDMEPGPGFFEPAKYFKRKTKDKTKCFVDELHNVHHVWSVKNT
jgi:hypothetical protein